MQEFINRIICGDCIEFMRTLPDNSVDLIFTSPPYADRRKTTYGGIKAEDYNDWFLEVAAEIKRILKPSGSLFLNIKAHCENGERHLYVYELIIRLRNDLRFRFVDEFTWTKNGVPGKFKGRFKNAFEPVFHFAKSADITFNPYSVATPMKEESIARAGRKASGETTNGSGFAGMRKNETMSGRKLALPSNHIHFPQKSNQYTAQSKHPAVFPEELPEFFIKAFSNEGDIVLDPFVGSGTTAKVAALLNRKYIGIDISEEYCELARKRVSDALEAN